MPFVIVRNDITKMPVDAIVNAADEALLGGGGVDGCIHRAAGPELLEVCRALHGCRTGDAKITKGYRLPCKYVIHTVGPVWRGGTNGEREQIISCYRKSLALAKEYGCETVAFPIISAGVFGYPKEAAMRVAADTIREFLAENDMTVYLVVFSRSSLRAGETMFPDIAEYIDDRYVDEHAMYRARPARRRPVFPGPESAPAKMPCADEGEYPAAAPCETEAPYPCAAAAHAAPAESLDELLAHMDAGFSETLLALIDRSGKKDSEIYKKANIDRKLFSKIRSNPAYKPSKPTAAALAIALELDWTETCDLLARAGLALTHSSKFDIIIEYFITRRNYDIFAINEALFAFDQSLLGA